MKYLFISLIFIFSIQTGQAQSSGSDHQGDYYYAFGYMSFGMLGGHKGTAISFGEEISIPVDNKDQIEEEAEDLEDRADFVNYMSSQGWECFSINVNVGDRILYEFAFRKRKE